jgi:hypothetical protein
VGGWIKRYRGAKLGVYVRWIKLDRFILLKGWMDGLIEVVRYLDYHLYRWVSGY